MSETASHYYVPPPPLALSERLKCKSRCPKRCAITAEVTQGADPDYAEVVVTHNSQHVVISVPGLQDASVDVLGRVFDRWSSVAHDLHRDEALASDWPVF